MSKEEEKAQSKSASAEYFIETEYFRHSKNGTVTLFHSSKLPTDSADKAKALSKRQDYYPDGLVIKKNYDTGKETRSYTNLLGEKVGEDGGYDPELTKKIKSPSREEIFRTSEFYYKNESAVMEYFNKLPDKPLGKSGLWDIDFWDT